MTGEEMAKKFDPMDGVCSDCGHCVDAEEKLLEAQDKIRALWAAYQDLSKKYKRARAALGEAERDAQMDFLESYDPPIDEEPH